MDAKKKLCFIITDAISFNVLYKGQLESLAASGLWDLTLVCGGSSIDFEVLRRRNVGKVFNVGFLRKPAVFKDFWVLLKLIAFLAFQNFDLVVYSTPKALFLGSIASALTFKKRRIAIIHGRVYENSRGISRKVWELVDRISLALSHRVVFVSKSLKSCYLEDGLVGASKSVVVGAGSANGVCSITFSPKHRCSTEARTLKEQLGIAETDFVIIVAGRLCVDKGVLELLKLSRTLASLSCKFLVIGNAEDDEAKKFKNQTSKDDQRFIFRDFDDNLSKYFAVSHLHVFLTRREGFGNVAIEAASSGIPTLAFDVVGVKDSVSHGVSGFRYKFNDVEQVGKFISEASLDPVKLLNFFDGARNWAIDNFEQGEVWRRYSEFYFSCCVNNGYGYEASV